MASPSHHDPRMGDEDTEEVSQIHQPMRRHVTLDMNPQFVDGGHREESVSDDSSGEAGAAQEESQEQDANSSRKRALIATWARLCNWVPFDLHWVLDNFVWSKLKPAIRVAVVAWVSLLFVIIPQLEIMLGQVRSFVLEIFVNDDCIFFYLSRLAFSSS